MENVRQVKGQERGLGLPFAIVDHKGLMQTNDLFIPTLRDFHVIFWFKKGSGKYFVDFEEYTFTAGTIVLLSKDQVSYFADFDRSAVEIQSIVFNPEFIYRNDSDLHHLFHFNMATHLQGIQVIKLNGEDSKQFEIYSENMIRVYRERVGESRSNAFYHWLNIFLLECRELQVITPEEGQIDEGQKILLRFQRLLESDFRTQTRVEYYQDQLGLSSKAFSNLTKAKFRLSPKSVIDQRRILEIKRQLKGTTKASKTIAYELGFDEPTNMVKFFKKHTGMTPTAFRN